MLFQSSPLKLPAPYPGRNAVMPVHASARAHRGVLLCDVARRVGNEGEGTSCSNHRSAKVDAVGTANGDDLALVPANDLHAGDLPTPDQLAQIFLRFVTSRPAIRADLAQVGRCYAVQSVGRTTDSQRIAVDNALRSGR